MIDFGKVISIDQNNNAVVQIERKQKCVGCNACHIASGGVMQLEVENTANAAVGDTVEIEISEKSITQSILIVYGIPLLLMLVGVIISSIYIKTEWIVGVIGIGALILGFVCVWALDKIFAKRKEYNPKMIKVLSIGAAEKTDTVEQDGRE